MDRIELTLFRGFKTKEYTIGVLICEKMSILATLELPDRDNQCDVSCIPEGTYVLVRGRRTGTDSPVLQVLGVSGRKGIQIHIGNTTDDIKGCILVGREFGKLNDRKAVLHSKWAMDHLLTRVKDAKEIILHIKEAFFYA